MLGERYAETLPSRKGNLQPSTLNLEAITGGKIGFGSLGLSGREAPLEGLFPRR